ncbi:MAG: DUF6152 family protein [Pseudomonadales bacterium]
MSARIKLFTCALFVWLCASTPLYGHHGTGINYDSNIKFSLPAEVVKFRYAQPHLQIFLNMRKTLEDEESEVVKWACEYVPNIPFLVRQGYSKKIMKAALPVGAEITVVMSPARSGKPVCLVHKMLSSEGELIGPDLEKMIMQGSRQ